MTDSVPGDTSDRGDRRSPTDLLNDLLRSARGWYASLEAEVQPVVTRVTSFGRNPGEEMKIAWNELVEGWNTRREELEQWLDGELSQVWTHVRLPSEADVERLTERLVALEKRIDALRARRMGAAD